MTQFFHFSFANISKTKKFITFSDSALSESEFSELSILKKAKAVKNNSKATEFNTDGISELVEKSLGKDRTN